MKLRNQEIIFSGMFIALSVVLTRFASLRIPIGGVEGIRIGFGTLPSVLAGILFGPWIGGIVGALADIIGFSLSPLGPYFPHFTLTSALHGFIPGILGYWFCWGNLEKRAIAAIFVNQVFVSGLLTPYFLHTIFGMPWQVLSLPRLFTIPLHIAVYSLLVVNLLRFPLRAVIAKKS